MDALKKDVRTSWGDIASGNFNFQESAGIWDVFLVLNRFESCFIESSLFSSGVRHSSQGRHLAFQGGPLEIWGNDTSTLVFQYPKVDQFKNCLPDSAVEFCADYFGPNGFSRRRTEKICPDNLG